MTQVARDRLYRRNRFPAEVISHAISLYFCFPLSLRMVEDLLAARGIIVSHQTVRLWAEKFGRHFAGEIRRRSSGRFGDKWYLVEVVMTISKKHWLWRNSRQAIPLTGRYNGDRADYDGMLLQVNVTTESARPNETTLRTTAPLMRMDD